MTPSTRSRHVDSRRSLRRIHKSYREDSTSDGGFSSEESEVYNARPSQSRRKPVASNSAVAPSVSQSQSSIKKRKSTDSQLPHSNARNVSKRGKRSAYEVHEKLETPIPTARIPSWHTLPYHVLVQVFRYASQPIATDTFYRTTSLQWLARTALVCKSFSEPALTVLYHSPLLSPPYRARGFLSRLRNQESVFNYQSKVRYLDVEAMETLYRKDKGHNPIDMGEMIAVTPQLRGIGIHLRRDFPSSYKSMHIMPRGKAMEVLQNILLALQQCNILLEEWKWNHATSDCIRKDQFSTMEKIHRSPPFQHLSKLSIVALSWLDAPARTAKSRGPEEMLGLAISALSDLKELHLILLPHLINPTLLPLLPKNLTTLEITECPIDSKMMASFLSTHGRCLRQLILNHNQSLNLSFLLQLAESCPVLELLTMDLSYYNAHYTFSDFEPKFDSLLERGETPSWPASLQRLELLYLRKWDNDIADNFFSSLIRAARHLKDLRHLNIKANLSESGWRERISFRNTWIARFQKVFLRVSPPPNPQLKSIGAYKAFKAQQAKSARSNQSDSTLKKHLSHVETSVTNMEETDMTGAMSSSDEPLVWRRRSSRLKRPGDDLHTSSASRPRLRHRPHKRRTKASDDESSEDSALDDEATVDHSGHEVESSDSDDELFIQGMCDTVRVSIDNLRPMEEQLAESDFLDEEISGDEDWNGDDDMFGNDGYAW